MIKKQLLLLFTFEDDFLVEQDQRNFDPDKVGQFQVLENIIYTLKTRLPQIDLTVCREVVG